MSSPVINYLTAEYQQFTALDKNCQKLLISNFAYGFVYLVLPIIANYFIFLEFQGLEQEQMIKYNLTYFVGYFVAIPFGFIINGFLLRKFRISHLYVVGMMAEIFVIVPLTFLHIKTMVPLFMIGSVMGIASGLYWSNRHYMSFFVTDNQNRNYVFGIDNALMTLGGFVTPLIFGFLTGTAWFTLSKLFPGLPDVTGRILLAAFLIFMIAIASYNILKGKYHNPEIKPFLFFKYCRTWNKQRLMNFLEGLTNGTLIVMPALIVLHIFKESGILGLLQSTGLIIGLLPIYFLGRYTKPRHRIHILFGSGVVLLISAVFLALNFDKPSATAFILSGNVVFSVLLMPYVAIRMRSMNLSAPIDKKEEYSYFVDVEITLGIGRIVGLFVFLMAYYYFSQIKALQFGFLIISLVPIIAALIIRTIKQE